MHLEIQVALNFLISNLYNKLPRRRVNIFGEELEKALKAKFQNHWYVDKPMKGQAFRCLKTGENGFPGPIDPVLVTAAENANIPIGDVVENLPAELALWIDPREVSYRIGQGPVKILWNECEMDELDREVSSQFNPESQIFQPIESPSLSPFNNFLFDVSTAKGPVVSLHQQHQQHQIQQQHPVQQHAPQHGATPQMMTTAAFAQTKFGSTKLKTSSKRTQRMSPTEFSNYIKQRAMQQQQQQQQGSTPTTRPRSLSPSAPQQLNFGPWESAIWSNNTETEQRKYLVVA